ncbi:GNAT family N-acetyltransferase [Sulfurimonas paralvinellae]|uniref:GNAT family N-acetyltransferase n=1 Tax=Sulfurimonas paralvinellae TaxID=317658 RepID=A0A7M1B819_9BACT|nr:GNAT family N-acetyltransferase [Sulfurimonas paralvinellae]QOP45887.1 GNAT family N-acetyltransferase [Sulfurimonas paralvinellae]
MTSSKFIIKPLTVETINQTVILRDKIFSDLKSYEKETLQASLDKNNYEECWKKNELTSMQYFIMLDTTKDKVMGLTGIYNEAEDTSDMCWLGWFCIDKEYRGQGLSKKLLNFSIDRAKELNKKYLHLYTYDSREYIPAMKLYEKYHFTIYDRDERDIYYKLDLKKKA